MKLMPQAGSDLRAALRALRRSPRFTAVAVAMLALGVAGNTAMFGVFSALFLRPLPFPDPARLVDLDEAAPKVGLDRIGVSQADACGWRQSNRTFEDVAFSYRVTFGLNHRGRARPVAVAQVTQGMTRVLGLRPLLGRDFLPEEDRPGGPAAVLLGYETWRRDFGGDPGVVGEIVRLGARPHTVVGVLPRGTVYPPNVDLWVPLAPDPSATGRYYLRGIGRLKPGVTPEQARADLARVHEQLIGDRGGVGSATSPLVSSLPERELGRLRGTTHALLAAVAVVLLVACVNVAALMLAQGVTRGRERAIRAALGASRASLVRQSLAETGLIAAAGGLGGAILGHAALRTLVRMVPADLLPSWVDFRLDLRFAAFCALLVGAAALVFGVMPSLQAGRARPRECLDGGRGASLGRGRHRFLSACVVTEVALAVVLLVGAGLLLRAYRSVLRVDPGFRTENVASFRLLVPEASYGTSEGRIALLPPLLERLAALPGVLSAGAASPPPLGGDSGSFFRAEGGWQPPPGDPDPVVSQVVATPGYFDAAGLRLVAGRTFRESDGQAARAAVVSESFVRRYWPGEDAVGRRVRFSWDAGSWMQVVGVVGDVRHFGLDQPPRATVYMPFRQQPMEPGFSIVLRTAADPHGLTGSVREVLKRTDPDLTLADLRTFAERVDESFWVRRASSWLMWTFAAVAALLATAGIFGVLAYVLTSRTREIGVRMAFGADAGRVMRDVVAGGLRLTAAGIALGCAVALAGARLLDGLLFGVEPHDPLTYGVVATATALVSLSVAATIARRVAGLDPVEALRCE
jgi:predicted permease